MIHIHTRATKSFALDTTETPLVTDNYIIVLFCFYSLKKQITTNRWELHEITADIKTVSYSPTGSGNV